MYYEVEIVKCFARAIPFIGTEKKCLRRQFTHVILVFFHEFVRGFAVPPLSAKTAIGKCVNTGYKLAIFFLLYLLVINKLTGYTFQKV